MSNLSGGAWTDDAVIAVEASIEKLLKSFLYNPYAHRVEHSLHVDLYNDLRSHAIFGGDHALGATGFTTRLVHKEWPTTELHARKEGGTPRRQSFDLAVLDPSDLATADLATFGEGRVRAAVAIELGLDYSDQHLAEDLDKFERNAATHAYIVHFSRKRSRRSSAVEQRIREQGHARVVFAHLDADKREVRFKGLNDDDISTRAV